MQQINLWMNKSSLYKLQTVSFTFSLTVFGGWDSWMKSIASWMVKKKIDVLISSSKNLQFLSFSMIYAGNGMSKVRVTAQFYYYIQLSYIIIAVVL